MVLTTKIAYITTVKLKFTSVKSFIRIDHRKGRDIERERSEKQKIDQIRSYQISSGIRQVAEKQVYANFLV